MPLKPIYSDKVVQAARKLEEESALLRAAAVDARASLTSDAAAVRSKPLRDLPAAPCFLSLPLFLDFVCCCRCCRTYS